MPMAVTGFEYLDIIERLYFFYRGNLLSIIY